MKKKLISISCVVLAITMCIGLVSCSGNKTHKETIVDKDKTTIASEQEQNKKDKKEQEEKQKITEFVTDKDGKHVTNKDGSYVTQVVDGNKVKKATEPTEKDKKKPSKKKDKTTTTTKKETTTKKKKKQTTTKKGKTTTTTTTIHYTTVDPDDAILTPDEPIDDEYVLTGSLAMFLLQQKYDKETYVVNLIEETEDYATLYVFVLENNDIYSKAKVNLRNGNTTEIIQKTKKKQTYNLAQ